MNVRRAMAWTTLALSFSLPLGAEEKSAGVDPQLLPSVNALDPEGSSVEKVTQEKSKQAYLEQLQIRLDHTARRANQPDSGSSSVIGLRGSRQEPLSKQLYWKGQKDPEPVNLDEVKDFRAAVEMAREGNPDEALAALKVFQIKYPASPLRADVEETIHFLNTPAPTASTHAPNTKAS